MHKLEKTFILVELAISHIQKPLPKAYTKDAGYQWSPKPEQPYLKALKQRKDPADYTFIRLDSFNTVFQVELLAILKCADYIQLVNTKNETICTCTNS